MKMSTKTAKRLTQKLIEDLHNHPHKDEILKLCLEQLMDIDMETNR